MQFYKHFKLYCNASKIQYPEGNIQIKWYLHLVFSDMRYANDKYFCSDTHHDYMQSHQQVLCKRKIEDRLKH